MRPVGSARLLLGTVLVLTLAPVAGVAQTAENPAQRDLGVGPSAVSWRYGHPSPSGLSGVVVQEPSMNVPLQGGTAMTYGAGAANPHVVAASGVIEVNGNTYVVQDNMLALGRRNNATGRVDEVPLPAGPNGDRKFRAELGNITSKPDLEAVSVMRDGRIVAFGSGSHASSQHIYIHDPKTGATEKINASAFYESLKTRKEFAGPGLNIEGAVVDGDKLILLQRGNYKGKDGRKGVNAIGEVPLADALANRPPKLSNVRQYDLGEMHGVPLTFSDAVKGKDGRLYFIASAESKDKLGSAVGFIDERGVARYGVVVGKDGKPANVKLEGITVRERDGKLVLIDDADSEDPSKLYEFEKPGDPRDNYRTPGSVTLYSEAAQGAIGLNAGPFKDGRWTWAEGRHGRIGLDVLRADGTARAALGITRQGLKADVVAQGQLTLIGLAGETGRYGFGNPGDLTNAGAQATGRVFAGADGQLVGTAHVTKQGVHLVGGAQVFAGVKAKTDISANVSLCGLAATGVGQGEVSAGAGAGALGFFKLDRATWTVRMGGHANAALGLGGGLGGTLEVSVEQIVRNPGAARDCVVRGVVAAAGLFVAGPARIGNAIANLYRSATGGTAPAAAPANGPPTVVSVIASMPLAGSNPGFAGTGTAVGRLADTRARGSTTARGTSDKATGAGFRR